MAIHWFPNDPERARVEYAGQVLHVVRKVARAMSDVYTMATWAVVVMEDGTLRDFVVNYNFELDRSESWAEVDITPELRELCARRMAEVERRAAESRRGEVARAIAERARRAAVTTKGARVRFVADARPKDLNGMEGTVFWSRGDRVGVATSDRKDAKGHHVDVVWTNARWLEPAV